MIFNMTTLQQNLDISRCPHCNVDRPNLSMVMPVIETKDYKFEGHRYWIIYKCSRCGGIVTASSPTAGGLVSEIYPSQVEVDDSLPVTAKSYLEQALNSMHAPAGAVMLAASSVDAMLKAKGYKDGSLHSRINRAAEDHLITSDMATWAHQVRLDANDQRHADENATLPDAADARKCVDFAMALGQFLFVLPARVQRGLAEAKTES
ncbi:MAG: hypothetical protein QOD32_3065 [Pyrinomonadaceae bacterium]|jgi:DNA-directed RNA polymerase subunit RPC12/RpoP|nr:hypothetical protein [Pyrinomonadaceae bacterium]